jgi:MarR family 2-MHQ and catechol resistance regulon transcriptional repressor
MAQTGTVNTEQQKFTNLMSELARAHHRLSLFEAEIHRQAGSGLTTPQAKVIFCLGNTEGLTCSDITDQTLITKGTLTGVIDRLEQKGLVQRWSDAQDGRKIIVDLTSAGKKVFKREYPRFVKKIQPRFDELSERNRKLATTLLGKIADQF